MKLTSFVSLSLFALLGHQLSQAAVTYRIYGTREGLVGGTTANGHVIASRDHFCALPSGTVLNSNGGRTYTVSLVNPANGRVASNVPVWDIGPWNTTDNYWHSPRVAWTSLPRGKPEAQAAYQDGFNGGKDGFGRAVANPAGIDLADGTFWDDLGMVNNGWIDVTYNWESGTPSIKDHVEVFARSSSGTLVQKSYANGVGWGNWIDLGGSITGGVGVCARNPNEVLVFARGSALNNLQQKSYSTSSGWGAWIGLGGTITSDPAVIARGSDKVEVFARSSTGTLVQKSYNSSSGWGPWIDLGGSITGGVGVCARNSNEVLVFARGASLNNLQQISYSATTGWGSWVGLGGTITSDPVAIARDATKVEVFARSSTGTLVQKSYSGSWGAWIDLGGSITGGVGVTARDSSEVLVFTRGSASNNLQQKSYSTSSGWSDWLGLGGVISSDPEAFAW